MDGRLVVLVIVLLVVRLDGTYDFPHPDLAELELGFVECFDGQVEEIEAVAVEDEVTLDAGTRWRRQELFKS